MGLDYIIDHLERGYHYGSPYGFLTSGEYEDCKEVLLLSFASGPDDPEDDIIFDYTGYIRTNIWDVFVKIWSELGMKPIKFEQFIPNIVGVGAKQQPYNVMEFTQSQPLFKKIVTFDIFIKLLSLIHKKDIKTAAEFFQYAPAIYKFLFENKKLWGRITINTLCDKYFKTYDHFTVGVIHNRDKIKRLLAEQLTKREEECVALKN